MIGDLEACFVLGQLYNNKLVLSLASPVDHKMYSLNRSGEVIMLRRSLKIKHMKKNFVQWFQTKIPPRFNYYHPRIFTSHSIAMM